MLVQSLEAASVFSRRGLFMGMRKAHDELKVEFVEAAPFWLAHPYDFDGCARTIIDCLTEQSQFRLKTKDLSRNKPKQSQQQRWLIQCKLLISWLIGEF
jgi:hypothetical protein